MLLELTGVLEDGSKRAEGSGVPVNPRRTISFQLGASVTLRLRVVTPDGNPVLGGKVRFAAKKRATDGSPSFFKEATPLTALVKLAGTMLT